MGCCGGRVRSSFKQAVLRKPTRKTKASAKRLQVPETGPVVVPSATAPYPGEFHRRGKKNVEETTVEAESPAVPETQNEE